MVDSYIFMLYERIKGFVIYITILMTCLYWSFAKLYRLCEKFFAVNFFVSVPIKLCSRYFNNNTALCDISCYIITN